MALFEIRFIKQLDFHVENTIAFMTGTMYFWSVSERYYIFAIFSTVLVLLSILSMATEIKWKKHALLRVHIFRDTYFGHSYNLLVGLYPMITHRKAHLMHIK